ncbi:homoserine O-acetyltransferase family protein [Verrucomicrobium spinosum]|uniref:homoserine O-acetyltransferase family protein n=1 Tax=Verrucomicrobium spinosum TaxID=2736 RepID=UPI000AACA4E9|nr:homoserine O-acetyltransferase [Verrucomicrobium spinosum]
MSNKTIPESQTQFLRFATPEKPFRFTSGMVMDDLTLAYETHGKLNEDKSNAILLFHALSGSQHAAGVCRHVPHTDDRWTEDCQQGWWSLFIGPGKALDTQKFFVICANYLGGCYGSSGPASLNPKTGRPYGPEFPQVSTADVVRSQALLLDHFGIEKLHAVMGASVGGLLTLNFATLFPERVRLVVSIASGQRTTVLSRLGVFEQVMAIENDPHFKGGNYYDSDPPAYGLALARMISHKTFVHLDAIERRARGDVIQRDDQLSWYRVGHNVESYMLHQGKKFVKRFDANTYLRICDMWLRFDRSKTRVSRTMGPSLPSAAGLVTTGWCSASTPTSASTRKNRPNWCAGWNRRTCPPCTSPCTRTRDTTHFSWSQSSTPLTSATRCDGVCSSMTLGITMPPVPASEPS